MTDEELVILSQNGDKTAWEELYKIYKPRVLTIARRFFLSGSETEDLVQEGMFGLISAVNSYRQNEGSFSAFAHSCIRNRIVDVVKRSGGDKHSALNNFLPIFEIGGEWVSPESPEDEVIRREDKQELLLKIKQILSPFEYEVVVKYIDGLTISEISSALETTSKSVDNALNRAKNKLQKLISAEE